MTPGAHTVVITSEVPRDGIQARCSGLELRDSLAIFLPGQTLHALLLRAPLAEKTVAAQVIATGTGALNIDGCRIDGQPRTTHKDGNFPNPHTRETHVYGKYKVGIEAEVPSGRWPTNVILIHGPGCVCQGTRKVSGRAYGLNASAGQVYGGGKGLVSQAKGDGIGGYADDDGKETVTAWDCQPDCPVRLLDAQSGTLTSGDPTGSVRNEGGNMLLGKGKGATLSGFGDSGGASRFFPQFESLHTALVWLGKLIDA